MNKIIKNAKRVELNIKISTAFLNTQTLDIIQQNTNFYVAARIIKKKLKKKKKLMKTQ